MDSINYFIHEHRTIVFFISILAIIISVGTLMVIASKVDKRLKLPSFVSKVLFGAFAIIGLLIGAFFIPTVLNPYNKGGIKELFIVKTDEGPQLTVWFIGIHPKKVGASYDQRLAAYDLQTGKHLGDTEMLHRHYSNEYRLFKTDDPMAWGYSKKSGLQLLDLVKPRVVADEAKLIERNPHMGEKINLFRGDDVYDPIANTIHVVGANENIYRVDVNLKATLVDHVPDQIIERGHEWDFAKGWYFYHLEHSLGEHLHTKGTKCSPDSVTLLEPKLIEELNEKVLTKSKVWVTHKSAIHGEYDPLISFVDGNGNELNRINLREVTENKKATALATFTQDHEILILITAGKTHLTSIKGFFLTALRTDPNTGELLGTIKYF